MAQCYDVIPKTLKNHKKIKNPYPNVDAHSGALLYSLDMKEYEFYTVMFAVSRTLGCMADTIWDRALGMKL